MFKNQDRYQIAMSFAHWKAGRSPTATFEMFYRYKKPYTEAVVCGTSLFRDSLKNFANDIRILGQRYKDLGITEGFLQEMSRQLSQTEILALPEGTIVPPNVPIVQISGPLPVVQLMETPLLHAVNFSTAVATVAHQCVQAARGKPVVELGLRRAPTGAGSVASRAAYVGGCEGSSNLNSEGIPTIGTMSHSWVLSFGSEQEAFQAYIDAYPENPVLLVDTYDSYDGADLALKVLKRNGIVGGIRLDSGDLKRQATYIRSIDKYVKIVASDDLNPKKIAALHPSPIDTYGVGTAIAWPETAFPGVFKLVELDGKPKSKTSQGKHSEPFKKRVIKNEDGLLIAGSNVQGHNLLQPLRSESLETIRKRVSNGLG